MRIYNYSNLSINRLKNLLKRPAEQDGQIFKRIKIITDDVKKHGDKAVFKYAQKFDSFNKTSIEISRKEIIKRAQLLPVEIKNAIKQSARNIEKFHMKQKPLNYSIEISPGIMCSRKFIPIENVGLYIPGGSAVLFSTMLMLGIPAKIAGSKRIVVSSPLGPDGLDPALAFAFLITESDQLYGVGGAHSIAMMAYGTESFSKVDKIFGPGNSYVTAAKSIVSIDPSGCAIDMPAGPSEVLVIADHKSRADFVASDLLSQAEHGYDSHALLFTTSSKLAFRVKGEIKKQIGILPRRKIATGSLSHSFILTVPSISKAIELSNYYAPEHLILNTENASDLTGLIKNAGSVFIGAYSPESAGDYSSGTNHSLPTYGYAKSYGGVTVESFMKSISFQKLSRAGLKKISNSVITLAEREGLQAHANSIKVRFSK